MEVNNNIIIATNQSGAANNTKVEVNVDVKVENNENAKPKDTVVYEKTKETEKQYKPDRAAIDKMLAESNDKANQMKTLLEKMFNKQSKTFDEAIQLISGKSPNQLYATQEVIDKAKADIAPGGYWSVEKTSDRIFDFAKALSGGDPKLIDKLRAAVEQGFDAAQSVWGKEKMPQITQDTYDAVMAKFDKWAEESKADKTVEETPKTPTQVVEADKAAKA